MYCETDRLWNIIRDCGNTCGLRLKDMDVVFGLQPGIMDFMAENGLIPPRAVLERFSLLSGMTPEELTGEKRASTDVEAPKYIFVLKDAEYIKPYYPLEYVLGRLCIDVDSSDKREYFAVMINDASMEEARLFPGDAAIVRRQATADEGDIVIARVGDKNVIRRYHRKKNVMWIMAEGPAKDLPGPVTDLLTNLERNVRILGKVIYSVRFFEDLGIKDR